MKDQYLTVTALTKYIKRLIDTDPHLNTIWLRGEISNFNHHSRGHMYLTIKDNQSRIQAVMFAGNNRHLKFTPENGMSVLIKGYVSVFEPFGQYQLYIKQLEPDGIGSLYLAYEQLKDELKKQGYFNEEYKRKIPVFPKHIGIVTSPSGAAVRDIITTIKRRYPIVKTTVIPAIVQGVHAASSIKEAIEKANHTDCFDVLIVGRGGGSIEELWAFNEKLVVEAIFHSDVPIISAIGHETDMTISDYVADLRAPTPTSAAELAVPSQYELKDNIKGMNRSLVRTMTMLVEDGQKHLQRLQGSYAFRYPEQLVKQKEQELDLLTTQAERALKNDLLSAQEYFANLKIRFINQHPEKRTEDSFEHLERLMMQLQQATNKILNDKSKELYLAVEKLTLLNPLEIMKRGFAIPYNDQDEIINSSKQLHKQDQLTLQFSDGTVACEVKEVHNDE